MEFLFFLSNYIFNYQEIKARSFLLPLLWRGWEEAYSFGEGWGEAFSIL
jgi:hypothetical protein